MKNALKIFSKYLEEGMRKIKLFKIYTDDNQTKHSSNPTDILKSAKKFIWKTLYQRDNFQNYHYWIY